MCYACKITHGHGYGCRISHGSSMYEYEYLRCIYPLNRVEGADNLYEMPPSPARRGGEMMAGSTRGALFLVLCLSMLMATQPAAGGAQVRQ